MAKIEPGKPTASGEPRWVVKWIAGYDDKGRGKYASRSCRTHREAVLLRSEKELLEKPRRHNLKPKANKNPRLSTVAQAYLQSLEKPMIGEDMPSLATRKQANSIIHNHVLVPELKNKGIRSIEPDSYRLIFARCETLGVGSSTRNHALRLLRCVLQFALKDGLVPFVPDNPIENRKTKQERREEKEYDGEKFYSPDEVYTMLCAADSLANDDNKQTRRTWARYRPLTYFLVFTGTRVSEARAFRRKHYRADIGKVLIYDSAPEGEDDDLSTKTPHGRRRVPLNAELAEVLGPWMASHNRDIVFGTANDNYISLTTLYPRLLKPLKTRANELAESGDDPRFVTIPVEGPDALGFHGFRHHFAAWLIKEGANLKQLSTYMDHSKSSFTLDVYGHLFDDDGKDLADRVSMKRSA